MSACKGCGAEITFAKHIVTNRNVPLERVKLPRGLYNLMPGGMVQPVDGIELYVSHFTTCPKANDFSGKNKAVAP